MPARVLFMLCDSYTERRVYIQRGIKIDKDKKECYFGKRGLYLRKETKIELIYKNRNIQNECINIKILTKVPENEKYTKNVAKLDKM